MFDEISPRSLTTALAHHAELNPQSYFTFETRIEIFDRTEIVGEVPIPELEWKPLEEPLSNYIKRGGSPNAHTADGCPLAVGLTRQGAFEDVRLLLTCDKFNAGKSERTTRRTALMENITHFNHEIDDMVELADALINSIKNERSRKSFVNLPDSENQSALSLAIKWGLEEMVSLLLDHKASPSDPPVKKILGTIHSVPRGNEKKDYNKDPMITPTDLRIKELIEHARKDKMRTHTYFLAPRK